MLVYDKDFFEKDKSVIKDKIKKRGTYIALGSFDGLHLGHMSLINKIVSLAKKNNCLSMVYNFINHPRKFLKPKEKLLLLTTFKEKVSILRNCNVDFAYFEKFDEEFMERSAEEFIRYLIHKFNAKGIVVGFNYKFGYKNSGNTEILKKLSKKYNFDIYIMNPCTYNNEVISSTRIRQEIENGNVSEALDMLNRPYRLEGVVERGRQIGRTIGFPTANVSFDEESIVPKVGVYYTNVIIDNNIYKGITNVGTNPTVNGKKLTVETFILDFNVDIYSRNIKVLFIKRIRQQVKFDSIEKLKMQLCIDKEYAIKEKILDCNSKKYLQH